MESGENNSRKKRTDYFFIRSENEIEKRKKVCDKILLLKDTTRDTKSFFEIPYKKIEREDQL